MSNVIMYIVIIAIYMAISLLAGIFAHKFRVTDKTAEDYLMAGRGVGSFVGFTSLIVSQQSALAFMGFVAYYYMWGISALASIMGMYVFGTCVFWFFAAPKIWKLGRRFLHSTPSDTLVEYYDSKILGYILGIALVIAVVPYLQAQFYGISIAIDMGTGGLVPFWLGGLIIAVVMAVYITLGGLRSVAWVDTMQGVLLLTALLGGGFVILYGVGGGAGEAFSKVIATAVERVKWPGPAPWTPTFALSWIIPVSIGWLIHPHMWQRIHYFKSGRSVQHMPLMAGLGHWIVVFGGYMIAVAGFLLVPNVPPDQLTLTMFLNYFPPIIFGIIIAAALAAMMSSASSQLFGISTVLSNDLLTKIPEKITEHETITYTRIVTLLVLFGSWAYAVLFPRYILVSGAIAASLGTSAAAPQTVAMITNRKFFTKWGAIAGLIAGVTVCIMFVGLVPSLKHYGGLYGGIYGLIANVIALFVVSAVTQRDRVQEETVEKFQDAYDTSMIDLNKEYRETSEELRKDYLTGEE